MSEKTVREVSLILATSNLYVALLSAVTASIVTVSTIADEKSSNQLNKLVRMIEDCLELCASMGNVSPRNEQDKQMLTILSAINSLTMTEVFGGTSTDKRLVEIREFLIEFQRSNTVGSPFEITMKPSSTEKVS